MALLAPSSVTATIIAGEHETFRRETDDTGRQLLDERSQPRLLDAERGELPRLLIPRARGDQTQLQPRLPV